MSHGLIPPPSRDLPPGRHDQMREVIMETIIEPSRSRRVSRRIAVLAASLAVAMLGAASVQADRLDLTLEDVLRDPSILFTADGARLESLSGEYPELEVEPHEAEEAIARLAADIPLPPGGSWDRLRQSLEESPASMDELGFRAMLEYNAACQWYGFWLNAQDIGDEDQAAVALSVLKEIPTWQSLQARDSGGVTSVFERLSADAHSGDPAFVREWHTINCTDSDVAD